MPRTRSTLRDVKPKSVFGKASGKLVDGGRAAITNNGTVIVEKYHVVDISAAAGDVRWLSMLAPGIPRHGDAHKTIPNIWVQNIESVSLPSSPTKTEVTVTWGFPTAKGSSGHFDNEPDDAAPATIEVSTTLQTLLTNRDVNGEPITIAFAPPLMGGEQGPPEPITQGGEIELQMPMTVVRLRRREPQSPGVDNSRKITPANSVGTLNDAIVFDDAKHVWLFSRCDGVSDDGGNTYNVTYEFIRAPQRFQDELETWDATIVWIDPETGKPHPGVSVGDGIETNIRVYREMDFSLLGI